MDISTILKFAGILVSGALGILGTVTETRNKKTGRLTPWGKCALWLTVAGLVTAFGAQLFDSINQHRDAIAQSAQNHIILTNIQHQAELANQSLDGIQRFDTRFNEKLSIDATFELPKDDPLIARIIAHLAKVKADTWPTTLEAYVGNDSLIGPINKFVQQFPTNDADVKFLFINLNFCLFNIGLNKELFSVGKVREVGGDMGDFDFQAIGFNEMVQDKHPFRKTTLRYDRSTQKLFLRFIADIPKTNWFSDQIITSIHDLGRAYCYPILETALGSIGTLDATETAGQSADAARVLANTFPIEINLTFDSYPAIALKTFKPLTMHAGADTNLLWEATLPTEADILNGNVTISTYLKVDRPTKQ